MRPRGSVFSARQQEHFFINDPFLALMSMVSTRPSVNVMAADNFSSKEGELEFDVVNLIANTESVYIQPSKDVYTHSFSTLIKSLTKLDT